MLVFFGSHSLKSSFVVDGICYDCNERFYVRGKAKYAEDHDPIKSVMSAGSETIK